MARGKLRLYLGAAPGVGKTFAMLHEGRRRRDRGTDVVVGFVETHGRQRTAEAIDDLEVLPCKTMSYRGATFTEMDVDAVLARHPQVALVDELAHTNVPGSRNAKRWQDVEELLQAGIEVISTVNIQHLESVNDVVQTITGVPQRETVPDAVVRAADQVELVDMSPEALHRRMAHGNIYAPERIDAALSNYFRIGNLSALRELALLWLADQVDEGLQRYRAEHGIEGRWEARERVVVALTGGPEGETLIRRAARIAARATGGDLRAVHVTSSSDGLPTADSEVLVKQQKLVESLGGSYHQVIGEEVPAALLEFARGVNATQLVLGVSRRSLLQALLAGPGIGATVTRLSGDIDVHMVTHEAAHNGWELPRFSSALSARRRLAGVLVAVAGLPLLTVVLAGWRDSMSLINEVLLFLLAVVGVALLGGFLPALLAALFATALLNYYFTPPLHTFTIAERHNLLALLVFVVVALMVSSVVDLAARRTSQAARATAEAETLSALASSVLRGERALPALLERVRETFGLTSVALLEREPGSAGRLGSGGWRQVAASGIDPASRPDQGEAAIPATDELVLVLRGRPLAAADRRVLGAFAAQAATALEQQRLGEAAAEAAPLAEADRTRTALLAAVSHDLRTPLASAKAAITSLRSTDISWRPEEQAELLATADESLDRLTGLVNDLLDMSRLQAGALALFVRPVALDEVVPLALDSIAPQTEVMVDVPDTLPEVLADPALLQRVVANLVDNALEHSFPDQPPRIIASSLRDRVELRVIDRGPGVAPEHHERMFTPFQRLGDRDNTTGVGLGLALSRGLVQAMGGTLVPEETPGGGLTMVVSLPAGPATPLPDDSARAAGGQS